MVEREIRKPKSEIRNKSETRKPKAETNPNLWEGANGKTESRNQRSLTAEITKIAEEDKAESLQQIRLFAACE